MSSIGPARQPSRPSDSDRDKGAKEIMDTIPRQSRTGHVEVRLPDTPSAAERPRALVTGGTGFVGRHLARRLLDDGSTVALVARSTSRIPRDLLDRCSFIDADAGADQMAWSIQRFAPSVCFHLATHFSNGHDFSDIDLVVDANVTFGTRILEALVRCGPVPVVNVGSRMQHYEASEYSPVSLYAATKQAFMDVMRYYAQVRGVPAVTVELPDTYGDDDPRRKLVTLLREAAITREPLLMSPGHQLVEIIHVSDAIGALIASVALADGGAPTFSAEGTTLPLRDFVREVESVLQREVPVEWGRRPYRDREMMTPWIHWPVLPGWTRSMDLREGLHSVLGPAARRTEPAV